MKSIHIEENVIGGYRWRPFTPTSNSSTLRFNSSTSNNTICIALCHKFQLSSFSPKLSR